MPAFSPDGKLLALVERKPLSRQRADGGVDRWEEANEVHLVAVATGKRLATLRHEGPQVPGIRDLCFSGDGDLLATAAHGLGDEKVCLWDLSGVRRGTGSASAKLRGTIPVPGAEGPLRLLGFTPGDREVVVEATVRRERLPISPGLRAVHLLDVTSGERAEQLQTTGHTLGQASPDGQTLAVGVRNTIELRDTLTGRLRASLEGHRDAVLGSLFSPDGHTLASWGRDGAVKLWDMSRPREIGRWQGSGVALPPDGKTLALWRGGHLRHVDLKTGLPTGEHRAANPDDAESRPRLLTYSADGKSIAVGVVGHREAGHMTLFEAATGKGLAGGTGAWGLHPGSNTLAVFHGTALGRMGLSREKGAIRVVTAGATKATVWEVFKGDQGSDVGPIGRPLFTGPYLGHSLVGFTPDGNAVVFVAALGYVEWWDRATGRLQRKVEYKAWKPLALHTDGKTLAAAEKLPPAQDATSVRLWDVEAGTNRLLGHHPDALTAAAFAPNCELLATGDACGTVKLWRVASGRFEAQFDTQSGSVQSLSFRADGRLLATSGADGVVKLWDLARDLARSSVKP